MNWRKITAVAAASVALALALALPVSPADLEKIAHGNAERLYGGKIE